MGSWTFQTHPFALRRFLAVGGIALIVSGCSAPRQEWLGINTHLGHWDYGGQWSSAKPSPQDREIYFGLLQELGTTNVRDLFMSWYRAQPTANSSYDFSVSDDLARRAAAANVDLLSLCSGIPSWAAAHPSGAGWSFGVPRRNQTDAFVNFLGAFVERYDGDGRRDMPGLRRPIRTYEFMCDMEDVPVAEYAYWLQVFYRTVKKADADARVVLGSLGSPGCKSVGRPEGNDDTYFDRLLACPELAGPGYPYFDIVAFKYYPLNYPGRKPFVDSLTYLHSAMEKHGATRPIWLTETGSRNGDNTPAALETQAADIVKLAIEARSLGIDRVFVHCLWDYRYPGRPDKVEGFGLVREAPSGRSPEHKPSFDAYRILCRQVQGHDRVRRIQEGLYSIDGGDTRYVAWHEDAYAPSALGGPLLDAWWNVQSLDGKSAVRHGAEIVPLTRAPVFLTSTLSPFMR